MTYQHKPLPSPEMERANAANMWAKECARSLRHVLGEVAVTDAEGWAEVRWHFQRLEAAVEEEARAFKVAA